MTEENIRSHPWYPAFRKWFQKLLLAPGAACLERDVLRDNYEALFKMYVERMERDEAENPQFYGRVKK